MSDYKELTVSINPRKADSDSDGLNDAFELRRGLDATDIDSR